MVVDEDDPHDLWAAAGVAAVVGRRSAARSRRAPRHLELHLGAVTVGTATVATPAVALHPAHDRLSQTQPVLGYGVRVEARPAVPHEDGDLLGLDLGVDRDRRVARRTSPR